MCGHDKVVEILLDAKADVNIKDNEGNTAISQFNKKK
jgi:ankyrin repeat protein